MAELWEAYREAYPGSTLGKTTFGRTLDRLGYPSVKRGNRMVRVGLRLKSRGSADALISALAEGQAIPKSVAAKTKRGLACD